MSKDSCRFHTGNTQWSMWICLLTWDCLSHYSFHNMAYKKMFNLVKLGVELKMNWLNGSIPISSGFQFQFNSNSKSLNSNPIQFILNWIELIINSNSIHELIRALVIICGKYGNNRSRTDNVTERTRFSKSRSNDLEDIGQGQKSLYAIHLIILVIICAKYGKNPLTTVDFFSRSSPKNFKKFAKNSNFHILKKKRNTQHIL